MPIKICGRCSFAVEGRKHVCPTCGFTSFTSPVIVKSDPQDRIQGQDLPQFAKSRLCYIRQELLCFIKNLKRAAKLVLQEIKAGQAEEGLEKGQDI